MQGWWRSWVTPPGGCARLSRSDRAYASWCAIHRKSHVDGKCPELRCNSLLEIIASDDSLCSADWCALRILLWLQARWIISKLRISVGAFSKSINFCRRRSSGSRAVAGRVVATVTGFKWAVTELKICRKYLSFSRHVSDKLWQRVKRHFFKNS